MSVQQEIDAYIASQPEAKRRDMQELHRSMLKLMCCHEFQWQAEFAFEQGYAVTASENKIHAAQWLQTPKGVHSMAAPEKVKGPASYFPSIEKAYGHPMEHWFGLVRKQQRSMKHMEIVNWLKAEHGMGHGHANAVVAFCFASAKD